MFFWKTKEIFWFVLLDRKELTPSCCSNLFSLLLCLLPLVYPLYLYLCYTIYLSAEKVGEFVGSSGRKAFLVTCLGRTEKQRRLSFHLKDSSLVSGQYELLSLPIDRSIYPCITAIDIFVCLSLCSFSLSLSVASVGFLSQETIESVVAQSKFFRSLSLSLWKAQILQSLEK